MCKTVVSINIANKLLDKLQDDDITYYWSILSANNTVNNITKYNSETGEWLYEINGNTNKYNFENSVWNKYIIDTDEWVEVNNEPTLLNSRETPTWLTLKLSVETVKVNEEITTLKLIIEAPETSPNDASEISYYAKFIAHQYDVEVAYQKQFKLISALTVETITITNMDTYKGETSIPKAKKAYSVYFDIRNGIDSLDIAITPKIAISPANARNTRVRFYAKDSNFNYIDVTQENSPLYLQETTGKFYPKQVGTYYILLISEDNILTLENDFPKDYANISIIKVEVADGSEAHPF